MSVLTTAHNYTNCKQLKNGATNIHRLINSDTILSLGTESLHVVKQEVQFHTKGQNLAVRLRPLAKEQYNFAEK